MNKQIKVFLSSTHEDMQPIHSTRIKFGIGDELVDSLSLPSPEEYLPLPDFAGESRGVALTLISDGQPIAGILLPVKSNQIDLSQMMPIIWPSRQTEARQSEQDHFIGQNRVSAGDFASGSMFFFRRQIGDHFRFNIDGYVNVNSELTETTHAFGQFVKYDSSGGIIVLDKYEPQVRIGGVDKTPLGGTIELGKATYGIVFEVDKGLYGTSIGVDESKIAIKIGSHVKVDGIQVGNLNDTLKIEIGHLKDTIMMDRPVKLDVIAIDNVVVDSISIPSSVEVEKTAFATIYGSGDSKVHSSVAKTATATIYSSSHYKFDASFDNVSANFRYTGKRDGFLEVIGNHLHLNRDGLFDREISFPANEGARLLSDFGKLLSYVHKANISELEFRVSAVSYDADAVGACAPFLDYFDAKAHPERKTKTVDQPTSNETTELEFSFGEGVSEKDMMSILGSLHQSLLDDTDGEGLVITSYSGGENAK
jgi:hypothetical protein